MRFYLSAASIIGITGCLISLAIAYVDFSWLFKSPELAFEQFLAWPWILFPLILTAFSIGSSFIYKTLSKKDHSRSTEAKIIYSIIFPPIAAFIAHPGLNQLETFSDGSYQIVFWGACITQFIVVSIVFKAIE